MLAKRRIHNAIKATEDKSPANTKGRKLRAFHVSTLEHDNDTHEHCF